MAVPLRNVLRSRESFWFDEGEWMRVVIRGRGEGLEYIGLYHTHPGRSPVPSLSDRHRMLECPGEVWLIVGFEPGVGCRWLPTAWVTTATPCCACRWRRLHDNVVTLQCNIVILQYNKVP